MRCHSIIPVRSVFPLIFSIMFVVLLLPAARPASAELDLANTPSDNLVLEQILIQKLLAGHYQDALDTGLPHLDPFSMSLANLRLLIQAARFEREFDLAHELIGLGRLIYPSEPSLELEDRLLNLAKGKCHQALRPIEKSGLSALQLDILETIHEQCPIDWMSTLHLSGWVSKPARTSSEVSKFLPADNSFIDQVCTVFSVGCGPIATKANATRVERLYLQAVWHLRHLRRDRLIEHINIQFQKNRALRGDTHGTQALMQYGWQITQPNYRVRPNILVGLDQNDVNGSSIKTQMIQVNSLSLEVPVIKNFALNTALRHTRISSDSGTTKIDFQDSGFDWQPLPTIHVSYKRGQAKTTRPAGDARGPSVTDSETFGIAAQFWDHYNLQFKRAKQTEKFSRTLYYLTAPHRIIKNTKTIRLDLPLSNSKEIWIEAEDVVSRSHDRLYNFDDSRLTLGFKAIY